MPVAAPAFDALADPTRRAILARLRAGPLLVGELTALLGVSQPTTSKHLRVLREAGLVEARVEGPRRRYVLLPGPLAAVDDWLAPYRWMWADRLDALERHLDSLDEDSGPTGEQG